MECNDVKIGMRVRTAQDVQAYGKQVKGMMINAKHLQARRANAIGNVRGYVPGHGGDVWWVEHADGSVAAYCFNEMEGENAPPLVKQS